MSGNFGAPPIDHRRPVVEPDMLFEEGDYVYDRSIRRAGRVAKAGAQEVEITCPQTRTSSRYVWSADNLVHEAAVELSLDEQAAIIQCRFWHEHPKVMEMLAG